MSRDHAHDHEHDRAREPFDPSLPAPLDVFTCALAGVNQIEASAGTGKTWNICALYVRLLLARDLNADQILVVTFTKAATAELHERIRSRLAELARAIELGDEGGDPFVAQLLATTLGPGGLDRELAGRRIRRALSTFDQAAIHTIHAFCQRALQEAPFAAAMPFAFEMEADDASLRFELAAEFWRERVEPVATAYPAFAAWLVARGATPLALDAQLARRLKKPLAELRWGASGASAPTLEPDDVDIGDDARAHFDAACALWRDEREVISHVLDQAQAGLKQTTHKSDAVRAALNAWGRYFAEGDCHASPPREALKLTATALAKATKVKFVPPEHPFFVLADTLAKASESAEATHRARWLSLLALWLEQAPAALAAMKRTRRLASFDDLLANLYGALTEHPWLADTLRARYPAALIDEFQDTDPLQFAIFQRIFGGAGRDGQIGPLFLVGDPKQAIYSFRAADLHTYLAARYAATARYTLAVNQRSTKLLVQACNRIFSANPRAFVLEGLDYTPVHAAQRMRAPFIDRDDPASVDGALRVWMLPSGEAVLIKREAQRQAAEACAAEIVRLLRGAREGAVKLGDAPLAPADIAVLVRTHKQGSLMKRVLAAWGVGSVELAQSSVFATLDAEQLERVMAAVEAPGDLRRLRAALAADWFGLDAHALARLAQLADAPAQAHADEATAWVERFSRYRSLWLERGFAAMWRSMMRELGIGERLIAGREGERRLTDVNHLAELASARAAVHPGIAPTLRWLAAERARGGGEEAQLRLESDRDLVQIVTVHKSKGLEYAVVFCPFLGDGARMTGAGTALPDAREYHDAARAVLHYGCEGSEAERAECEAAREEAAERARLVYVALTRAVYRCYLVAGVYLSSRSTREARRSVLNWLVTGDDRPFEAWFDDPPDEGALDAAWKALADGPTDGPTDGPISLTPLPAPQRRVPLVRESASGRRFVARTSRRMLTESWRIASFSSLASAVQHANETVDDEPRPDHDALAAAQQDAQEADAGWQSAPLPATPAPTPVQLLADDDILAFPRGAAAGECLHRMFELADFSASATWPAAIERALIERPVAADPETAARLPAMMMRLMADVTKTELAPGFTLASLDPERRLTEWPFLFASPALDLRALSALLTRHGYPDVLFEASLLAGFVKGFVDMVVEREGRFWIIDWKSNHLGATASDYGAAALEAAMAHHAYHLQALLYTVALHRYLKARLPRYDYDTHIGGYAYLFVRGVRPAWRDGLAPAGVVLRRPSRELIEALDETMRGEPAQ